MLFPKIRITANWTLPEIFYLFRSISCYAILKIIQKPCYCFFLFKYYFMNYVMIWHTATNSTLKMWRRRLYLVLSWALLLICRKGFMSRRGRTWCWTRTGWSHIWTSTMASGKTARQHGKTKLFDNSMTLTAFLKEEKDEWQGGRYRYVRDFHP